MLRNTLLKHKRFVESKLIINTFIILEIRSNYVLEFLGGGNFGKSEDEIEPLMSLMSGRGEVFELEISASGIVDDMAELYNFLVPAIVIFFV